MREASTLEGSQTNSDEVLIELAQESGLDVAKFIKSFTYGSAESDFQSDLQTAIKYGVRG